jgi:hypothetical protein
MLNLIIHLNVHCLHKKQEAKKVCECKTKVVLLVFSAVFTPIKIIGGTTSEEFQYRIQTHHPI